MILPIYADGGGGCRTARIVRGTIACIRRRQGMGKDGRAWVRMAGGGQRRQVFYKDGGHVLTKIRGTMEDGRGWVITAGDA